MNIYYIVGFAVSALLLVWYIAKLHKNKTSGHQVDFTEGVAHFVVLAVLAAATVFFGTTLF